MTSSSNVNELMLKCAVKELTKFAKSPVSDATFLEGYSYMLEYQKVLKQDDTFLDVLIDYSKSVRGAHLALQRLSANYITRQKEMPRSLQNWVVGYLQGDYSMPSSGKRGPNKTELRHVILTQLVLKLRMIGYLPIYPSVKSSGPAILDVIAQAQNILLKTKPVIGEDRFQTITQIEKQRIKRILPTSTSGLISLYKKALKENPHLKISFSEF